jgi:hypothetical protein
MNTVFKLDNTTGYLNSKVEILGSQMEIMYNLMWENNEKLTDEEKAEVFDQMKLPLRIAFDYFCEVRETTSVLMDLIQSVFDEARLVNEKLDRYDGAEEVMQLNASDREQVMRFLRTYTKADQEGE